MSVVTISILLGLLAVVYGIVTSRQVLSASAGTPRMQEIAAAIQEGAKAYLGRQYRTIAIVGVVVAVLVYVFLGATSAIGFAIGAILSGVAGYIGMNISVRANVRTAAAAQTGLQAGLTMAFRAGAITGMLVAGLALLAIAVFFWYLTEVAMHETTGEQLPWPEASRLDHARSNWPEFERKHGASSQSPLQQEHHHVGDQQSLRNRGQLGEHGQSLGVDARIIPACIPCPWRSCTTLPPLPRP